MRPPYYDSPLRIQLKKLMVLSETDVKGFCEICKIERGPVYNVLARRQTYISRESLNCISKAFNVSVNWLLTDEAETVWERRIDILCNLCAEWRNEWKNEIDK